MLGLFGDGVDVQLPLEVLGDCGAEETERLQCLLESHRVMVGLGSSGSLRSPDMIPTRDEPDEAGVVTWM